MIATVNDIKTKGRPVSRHLHDDVILPLIRESEMKEIRHALGDALYLDLDAYVDANRNPVNEAYSNLLDGCTWKMNGEKRIVIGLIEIICYLTQGRLVKAGDLHITRAGNKLKGNENSETADIKDRIAFYKDLFITAQEYLKGVVEYIRINLENSCKNTAKIYPKSVTIQAIGD